MSDTAAASAHAGSKRAAEFTADDAKRSKDCEAEEESDEESSADEAELTEDISRLADLPPVFWSQLNEQFTEGDDLKLAGLSKSYGNAFLHTESPSLFNLRGPAGTCGDLRGGT